MNLVRAAVYAFFSTFWIGTGILGWTTIPAIYVMGCFVAGICCAGQAVSSGKELAEEVTVSDRRNRRARRPQDG